MINNVILVGEILKIKKIETKEGYDFYCVNVLTSHDFKKHDGTMRTESVCHKVNIFDNMKHVIEEQASVGDIAYIEGSITKRKYQKNGEYKIDCQVICRNISVRLNIKQKDIHCDEELDRNDGFFTRLGFDSIFPSLKKKSSP